MQRFLRYELWKRNLNNVCNFVKFRQICHPYLFEKRRTTIWRDISCLWNVQKKHNFFLRTLILRLERCEGMHILWIPRNAANAPNLAIGGVYTAKNEPSKIRQLTNTIRRSVNWWPYPHSLYAQASDDFCRQSRGRVVAPISLQACAALLAKGHHVDRFDAV